MTPAIALLTFAGIMLVSGFRNKSIVNTVLGRDEENPGGRVPDVSSVTGSVVDSLTTAVRGTSATGNYARLRQEMDRIAFLLLPYKWGGGHAGYPPDGPFDCSGAVSYVLHAAGYHHGPPLISTGFMAWGRSGRGQDFTVYANPTHVFIRDERTGRDWGTTKTVGNGGPAWHTHTTRGFVARHAGPSHSSAQNVSQKRSGN